MAYQLQQRLGRGGMGVVDLALDERGRPVALKRLALYGSAVEIDRARTRVRREAEALARLSHPHVVPLLGVVDDGDDLVLVMPYLAGGTLSDQVRAYGPLRAEQILALAGPLLDALANAHQNGIVHRDIKPANVLFDLDGRPFLGDFGIASFRDATSGLTATGSIIGTPDFMAPEQARGERSTPPTDVFALAATLLYGATARRPYGTADARVAVARAANGQVDALPNDLDPRLARLLKPMLRPNADKRPSARDAAELARSLVAPPRRRRRWLFALLAATVLVGAPAAAIAGWAVAGADRSPTTATTATTTATVATTVPPTTAVPTTPPCKDLPYQPCGQAAAPHTDGKACVDSFVDLDGSAGNGCEAAPDTIDGQRLDKSLTANLVPTDDTDRYPFHVNDNFGCGGEVVVTLTSPANTAMKLQLLDAKGKTVGEGTSDNGKAARVTLDEPSCGRNDDGDYTAVVSYSGSKHSGAKYTLTKSGNF